MAAEQKVHMGFARLDLRWQPKLQCGQNFTARGFVVAQYLDVLKGNTHPISYHFMK
jgi:hypothetical protein